MKAVKILFFTLIFSSLLFMVSNAEETAGTVYKSNVVGYINNYSVSAYNIGGNTYIDVGDLSSYGFDVLYSRVYKTVNIKRNDQMSVSNSNAYRTPEDHIGDKDFDVFKGDISVYVNNEPVESVYDSKGNIYINIEEMNRYGVIVWSEYEHAIKLFIEDGLSMRFTPEYIPYDVSYIECDRMNCRKMTESYAGNFAAWDNYIVFFGLTREEESIVKGSSECTCQLNVIITDSQGNKLYSGNKMFFPSDFSVTPYYYGWSKAPLSIMYSIPNSQIRSRDGKGTIKVQYSCLSCGTTLEKTFDVTDLPLINNSL